MASYALYKPKRDTAEGGYVSAATAASINDSGGETYKGIARNYNPSWPGWKIIDAYKRAHGGIKHNFIIPDKNLDILVEDFYQKVFWTDMKLDRVKNQSVAEAIADFAVNSGVGTAVKAVQLSLGIKDDGKLGEQTLAAINSANQKQLFENIQRRRIDHINKRPDSFDPVLIDRVNKFVFETQVAPLLKAVEIVKKNWKPILAVTLVVGAVTATVLIIKKYNK